MVSPHPATCPGKGHLATIMDQEENDFVSILSKGVNAWIGYHQPSPVPVPGGGDEGGWEWVTGEVSPTSYTNWHLPSGQPSNSGGNQHAAFINYDPAGTWDDSWSGHLLGYIVEWDCQCGKC